MVLDGSKIHIQKIVKNGFGWAKNTYSKNGEKMVAGCPEGYAIDILKKGARTKFSRPGAKGQLAGLLRVPVSLNGGNIRHYKK